MYIYVSIYTYIHIYMYKYIYIIPINWQALTKQFKEEGGKWIQPLNWSVMLEFLERSKSSVWSREHQAAYRSCLSNSQWCQKRLFDAQLVDSDICRLCLNQTGDIWHRRYECGISWQLCQELAAKQPRHAAVVAKNTSWVVGENFAKGLFPTPVALLPPPLGESQAPIHWINKPAGGRMHGILFTDGSGRFPNVPELRRAGWSIVMVDRFGDFISAAYGPVPFQVAPEQNSRDGEDFAVFMCTQLVMAPFMLYVDCKATVACASRNSSYSVGPGNERAHLWTKFWSAFEGENFEVHKTLAHASSEQVDAGLTTEWERKGNNHADRLAKAGAKAHPLSNKHFREWRALRQVAKEACKWAGTHEVLLRRRGWRDHADLGDLASSKDQRLLLVPGAGKVTSASPLRLTELSCIPVRGHTCKKAALRDGSIVFCCTLCGSYAWRSAKAFKRDCVGKQGGGKGAAAQLQRFLSGRFPAQNQAHVVIGEPVDISVADREWLLNRIPAPGVGNEASSRRLFRAYREKNAWRLMD